MLKRRGDIIYWLGDSLYLNITNFCSNSCYFCFKHFWDGIAGFRLKLDAEPGINEIIGELKGYISRRRWREVVFCGFGEPTARLNCIIEVTKWIKRYYPFIRVRLDTNGHALLLNPGRNVVEELKGAGLDAVSISLNGHDEETYNRVCRPVFKGAYKSVIDFIIDARNSSLDVEITAVNIPEIDISKIRDLADKLNVKFRVREFISCLY